MKARVTPTKEVQILGLDKRDISNIFWCAMSYRTDRLFWCDGYLLCIENCEDSMSYEMEKGVFPVSQVCYIKFPKYVKFHEVEKGVLIPIVDVSDMKLYREIVNLIKEREADEEQTTDQ